MKRQASILAGIEGVLQAVHTLELRCEAEAGPPVRTSYAFRIGATCLRVESLNDTSEIRVGVGTLVAPLCQEPGWTHRTLDVSEESRFTRLIGRQLAESWLLTNSRGYQDGLMMAFGPMDGLCLVVINDHISVSLVTGERIA
jgi:hypothetical protein